MEMRWIAGLLLSLVATTVTFGQSPPVVLTGPTNTCTNQAASTAFVCNQITAQSGLPAGPAGAMLYYDPSAIVTPTGVLNTNSLIVWGAPPTSLSLGTAGQV